MKKQSIIKGTLILTIGGLISRILGFINRIYLSNLIGAEGMGLYQLVFPIYMICYTICCSGLFTAISRLTAEENAKGSKANVKKMLIVATSISMTLALALTALLFIFSKFVSIYMIHEPRIENCLRIIALSIPFTALASSIKGYFYGINKPTLPAVSQIVEQIVRITFIFLMSATFLNKGLSYACTIAVIGMVLGEISSCLLVSVFYHNNAKKVLLKKASCTYRYFYKKIRNIALPLTTNRLVTTALSSFETILIPSQLRAFGYTHSYAMSIFGTLTGMALPLIFFPTVVTTSASLVLLPAVSEAHAKKQKTTIKTIVSKTIKFSLLIGIVFAFFFFAFGNNVGTIVYGESYVGTLLVSLSLLCPFLYLQTTLGSLLNGIDKHMITFRNSIIGLAMRIAFIYLFVPTYGIQGYLIGLIVSLVVVGVLDIYYLVKATGLYFNVFTYVLLPVFCCVGTLALHQIWNHLKAVSFGLKINTLIDIVFYFIVLIPILFLTRCISLKDFKVK